jgi:maltose O-acetyltransferase
MTPSEKEKMLAGELYRSTDAELQSLMADAQRQLRQLNGIANEDAEQRFTALQAILGRVGSGTQIKSPFTCDYGLHIRIGRNGFVNYGCVFLDCNLISIGMTHRLDRAFISIQPFILLIPGFGAADWRRRNL